MRATIIGVAASLCLASAVVAETPAPPDPRVGAYGRVPVDPDIRAAADFAARQQHVILKKILVARRAMTFDTYYRLCLRVEDAEEVFLAEARVSKPQKDAFTLDGWTRIDRCE